MPDLNEFLNIKRLESRGHWGIKCGLENPKTLLAGLGHPEKAFPAILIAGTNGKGSTGAFLANALRACGFNIGWTTSPHLISARERIWLNGRSLGEAELDSLLGEVFACEKRLGLQATYFELMIASAILAFQKHPVDLAILEAGMGGRWDATNATDPLMTVLTNVGLDHTQYLGNTREAIAREKLCTSRSGRPLVLGPTLELGWIKALLETDPLLCPTTLLTAEEIHWGHSIVQGHRIGLAGDYQLENLTTALEALHQLRAMDFALPEDLLWEGLSQTRWPGRLWQVPGKPVWLDGAHNPDGARALARHARQCQFRPHLFFGAMADKDLAPMCEALKTISPKSLTLVQGTNERYAKEKQLREAWGRDCSAPVLSVEQVADSLHKKGEAPCLVTGSLFLLGDILRSMGIGLP